MCLKPDTSGLNALGGCDLGGEEVLVLDVLLSHLGTGFLTPFSAGVGFPGGTSGYEPTRQCRRPKTQGFCPWVGKTPWRRAWQPTPVFLPGESRDRGAWWATVHGVTESQTRLKRLSTHLLVMIRDIMIIACPAQMDWTRVSHIVDRRFTIWATREVHNKW